MSKVDIKRLDSVTKNDTTATEQINDNFKALQAAIENTVSRDGTVPNYMDADLDLNSYRIINAAAPVEGKDVVTLEYFEEKAGGAVEAAAEARASASKAASSAQSALVASNNAIGQLAQAEGLLTAAEGQLEDTKQYVNAAKSDIEDTKNTAIETINNTVVSAKADINSAIDEATMNIGNIVSDAEGSITNIAVTEANKAIANAAQEATDTATANLNSYVDGTVKPSLQTYVDQAQADANSAAVSMEQAALSATAASNYASNASADADNAAESATHAATSAADSEHYSEDSRIWAEGTDSEVQGLGGVHSSKVWSETAQAVVDGKQDIATAVNYKNITNCITEIPQDIKLELNNGVLTLKAGSKVYVPNGFESDGTTLKFDVVALPGDFKLTYSTHTDTYSNFIQFTNELGDGTSRYFNVSRAIYSGTTAPTSSTSSYLIWYDTANNLIKESQDYGATWLTDRKFSLPNSLVTTSNGTVTSIDQVFNGFGYIGSTVFALPGVKGLVPNGRNADGSLRNIEFTLNSVKTATRTWIDGDSIQVWGFCINPPAGMTETWYWNSYVESETEPSYTAYAIWYKPSENITYVNNQGGSKNWVKVNYINFGKAGGINSQEVKIFTPKTAFHAVDYSDKSVISGWGMPSSRYINLTLGASGTSYTAPANGYFAILKAATSTKQYMQFRNATTGLGIETHATSDYTELRQFVPVKKKDAVVIVYTAAGTLTFFRFIYAEGEN